MSATEDTLDRTFGALSDRRRRAILARLAKSPATVNQIAELYGKARVQGRLFAEDINQLTGRGIPIIGELAKQFGVSDSQVCQCVFG